MEIIKCEKGHFYNGEIYSECPECARINEQSYQMILENDGLGVDTIDVASISRIQKQYVYCPKCQAMVDKSFSRCPRCGATTQDPMRCDEKLLSTLLWRGELEKYEQYIWNPTESMGELEALTVQHDDRILYIQGQKLLFYKKSGVYVGMGVNRLVVDLSPEDLNRIQRQLERTPFDRWVTPIAKLNHKYNKGDTSTDFYLECKDGLVFTHAGGFWNAPGYLKLSALVWDIVKSSPEYFPELDKDPAYDDKRMSPEYYVALYCKNTDVLLERREALYEDIRIVIDQRSGIGFANSWRDRSLCDLFCSMGVLYLNENAAACIEKGEKWQQVTENTALQEGDRFRIKDIIFSVKSFKIKNPDAKECGIHQRRLIAKAVEDEILGSIDRECLQQNIENVCHIFVGYRGNLKEETNGERRLFPTAGFDPNGILCKLEQKAEYKQYLQSLETEGRCCPDLLAAEILVRLEYCIWMEEMLAGEEEENEYIQNHEILKLLLRLDDLLVPWLEENDRVTD